MVTDTFSCGYRATGAAAVSACTRHAAQHRILLQRSKNIGSVETREIPDVKRRQCMESLLKEFRFIYTLLLACFPLSFCSRYIGSLREPRTGGADGCEKTHCRPRGGNRLPDRRRAHRARVY
jgi:hypothetical protein